MNHHKEKNSDKSLSVHSSQNHSPSLCKNLKEKQVGGSGNLFNFFLVYAFQTPKFEIKIVLTF